MSVKLNAATQKTVTTAGTRVQISTSATEITTLVVQADPTNTGYVYVGDSAVSSTVAFAALAAGQAFALSQDPSGRAGGEELVLSDYWIDSSVSGAKAYVSHIKRR